MSILTTEALDTIRRFQGELKRGWDAREEIARIISPSSWLTERAARPDQGDVKRADRAESRAKSLAKADAILPPHAVITSDYWAAELPALVERLCREIDGQQVPSGVDALIDEAQAFLPQLVGTLPVCPFDRRSPDYWTTANDKPCHVCGGTEGGR